MQNAAGYFIIILLFFSSIVQTLVLPSQCDETILKLTGVVRKLDSAITIIFSISA